MTPEERADRLAEQHWPGGPYGALVEFRKALAAEIRAAIDEAVSDAMFERNLQDDRNTE